MCLCVYMHRQQCDDDDSNVGNVNNHETPSTDVIMHNNEIIIINLLSISWIAPHSNLNWLMNFESELNQTFSLFTFYLNVTTNTHRIVDDTLSLYKMYICMYILYKWNKMEERNQRQMAINIFLLNKSNETAN